MPRQLITIEVSYSIDPDEGWPEDRDPPALWSFESALDSYYDEEMMDDKEYPYYTNGVHVVQAGPVYSIPSDPDYISTD